MSSISSSSTDAQVWDAYDDNASYEEDDSRTKALAFITACRIIMRRRPSMTSRGEQSVNFESIASEMASARKWVAANRTASQISERFASFNTFRDH